MNITIQLIILIATVFGIVSLFLLLDFNDSLLRDILVPLGISTTITIVLLLWTTVFCLSEWKIDKEISKKCYDVDGVQVISVTHKNHTELININEKFGRSFPPQQEFRVVIYKRGPYVGLYLSKLKEPYMDIKIGKLMDEPK